MDTDRIKEILQQSIDVKSRILNDAKLITAIQYQIDIFVKTLKSGHKIWFCGNGGSAADAQHIAAELSGRFYLERNAYAAEALHVNTSFLTAVANDYGFDHVYARAIEALGNSGDLLVAISTSGNSINILNAVQKAKQMDITTLGWAGKDGGELLKQCDHVIIIPSEDTPRIQEAHITIGHIICEMVEIRMI